MKNEASRREYVIDGMTCGHCEASVAEEIADVGGVQSVSVDRLTGRVSVSGGFTDDDIRAAVESAGYKLVARA